MTAIEPLAAPVRRLEWRRAKVRQVIIETSRVKSLLLEVAGWRGHLPGQHVDIRLTGEDGCQAQRSYSIASPPEDGLIALTVERVENGEISPYLVDELRSGDQFELRGPIGGYFVWDPDTDRGPLLLAAGGSGVVPLRAILRHRERTGAAAQARLLYSARSLPDVIYRQEFERPGAGLDVILTLTRVRPPGWSGRAGRVDAALLAEVAWPAGQDPLAYVCGPTSFVEGVAEALVGLGYPAARVKTERFGATGGR
jgi:ferredoxin-NADP reductase